MAPTLRGGSCLVQPTAPGSPSPLIAKTGLSRSGAARATLRSTTEGEEIEESTEQQRQEAALHVVTEDTEGRRNTEKTRRLPPLPNVLRTVAPDRRQSRRSAGEARKVARQLSCREGHTLIFPSDLDVAATLSFPPLLPEPLQAHHPPTTSWPTPPATPAPPPPGPPTPSPPTPPPPHGHRPPPAPPRCPA